MPAAGCTHCPLTLIATTADKADERTHACRTFPYHAWDPSIDLGMALSSDHSTKQAGTGGSDRIPTNPMSWMTAKPAKKINTISTGWRELLAAPDKKRTSGPHKEMHGPPLSNNNQAYFVNASLRLPSAVA